MSISSTHESKIDAIVMVLCKAYNVYRLTGIKDILDAIQDEQDRKVDALSKGEIVELDEDKIYLGWLKGITAATSAVRYDFVVHGREIIIPRRLMSEVSLTVMKAAMTVELWSIEMFRYYIELCDFNAYDSIHTDGERKKMRKAVNIMKRGLKKL
jgi:hypothetical protein